MLELPEPTAGTLWKLEWWLLEGLYGRVLWPDAIRHALAELGEHQERKRRILAAKDADVAGNREGLVTRDPEVTSAKAARRVTPRTGSQRAKILAAIVENGGLTDLELSSKLAILDNSVRPRRAELLADGYVENSGATRRHRGSEWVVWSATDEGSAWYARQDLGTPGAAAA